MINLRRFPGVLFSYKTELFILILTTVSITHLVHRLGYACTNYEITREIDRVCKLYKAGMAMGNLCNPLCDTHEIHSISCITHFSKKQFVFVAKWKKRLIVLKSSQSTKRLLTRPTMSSRFADNKKKPFKETFPKLLSRLSRPRGSPNKESQSEEEEDPAEKIFENLIRSVASEMLNVTLTRSQLYELKNLNSKYSGSMDSEKRKIERENVLALLNSQEYLLLKLFSEKEVFPQVLGTCGPYYGVEHLERPTYNSLFTLDDKSEWSERMKLAIAIMDFVEEVETNFPDALYLCDVQMKHLGVTPSGRVKFLDLDLVYMKNLMDKTLRSGRPCHQHKDCDFLDCKSTCDPEKNVCDAGIANDNLQTVCEKIFIGWTMAGKMIIPGLLMSEYTPASLSALLRLCAENRRQPVHEDLRQKLYTTLTEMHQILTQKLSPE